MLDVNAGRESKIFLLNLGMKERDRETERDRERQSETERDRARQRERERDRERQRETERDREGQGIFSA